MPLEPPRWTGQQQDRQYDKWSGDDREKKRPEKTHPAIDAEKSRQDAEDDIDDRFEHLPLSRHCPGLSALESVAATAEHYQLPAVLAASDPDCDDLLLRRESHMSR